ncbi:putative homoserine dehydrogenase-like protein [Kushneria sinocarnis]|uniref:Putative homoserine dehydrogenase-like protein n=1 Tax=Kushneria sinocarnis TaxID=595502 RepID=A0A420X1K7_9GAMM|nr:flagellar biosynthesis protein FlgA [Kushneria sinocarnis]RKR07630.1 putative homoserine dehydrogenase-like protein [Kushneria sinocarnis]
MNYQSYFATDTVVEACVAGAGDFGTGVIGQSLEMKALSVRVVVDVDAGRAHQALRRAGVAESLIRECHDRESALQAWHEGYFIATGEHRVALALPFDILVEATGIPEVGARLAHEAIQAGKHVGIATKETESVIGPWLTWQARERGLVFTPLDGDQPSLLIGLISWARTLGFEIIAAGKSSEYDFIRHHDSETVTSNHRTHEATGIADCWPLDAHEVSTTLAGRAEATRSIVSVSVPDLCEMTNVANATGLMPDRPELHAPVLRIPEVPSVLDTREEGGILQESGRLEVFSCLRFDDEVSFAGGVFVVIRCDESKGWSLLRDKGHVMGRNGKSAMVYLPRHLLGWEAPISLLDAVLHGMPSGGGDATAPHLDLVARATRDLPAGHRFEMSGHHRVIDGLRPEMLPAQPIDDGGRAPFYLLPDAVLARPIAAGEPIPFDALEIAADTMLLRLRREQDRHFFTTCSTGVTA